MVFPARGAVLFVHGCFWHGHDCHLFRLPATRPEFWGAKIARNRQIDSLAHARLVEAGWRAGVVWECALTGRARLPLEEVLDACEHWLRHGEPSLDVRGWADTRGR